MSVALVTGGSQGVGKGIVEGLAEAGHRVFFTGRNAQRLSKTAEEAGALGGQALARCVDHTDDDQVRALFDEIEGGNQLDLLVNSVWGGYERMVEGGKFTWASPFWEQSLSRWDSMMSTGVRSAFVATQHATRMMLRQSAGLIVNISYWSAQKHIANVLYGMAKAATDKMTADMAKELESHQISVVSLYPGLVRTEKVMENAEFLDLSDSESPRFVGRTIAAMWREPTMVKKLSGKVCIAAQLARNLGVTDIDGKSPTPLTLESS